MGRALGESVGNRNRGVLSWAAALFVTLVAQVSAETPARFIDLDKPNATTAIGQQIIFQMFTATGEQGIKLHNVSGKVLSVQNATTLATLTLQPGMSIGLRCDAPQHLVISLDKDVAYETVACGSLMRFISAGGQP